MGSRIDLTASILSLLTLLICSSVLLTKAADGQTVVNSFNPGLGQLNGIGFDDATDTIYVHASFGNTIELYDLSGNNIGTIADPGDSGNDSDYFFTSVAVNVNGVMIPANTLLIIEDDSGAAELIAYDQTSQTVLSTLELPFVTGQLVGGEYNPATGTFFAVDWSADTIYEFNGADGSLIESFSVGASFDVFFGDLAVNEANGNLYVVSSSQNILRVLDPDGIVLTDVDLTTTTVTGMSGIAFRESSGEVIICSTNGTIYQVDGLPASITPVSFTVTRGLFVAGGVDNLAGSDNVDLSARRNTADIQSRVEVEVKGVAVNDVPTSLTLKLEASVFARSEVNQILEMWDYDLGSWEAVDSQAASRFTDMAVEITLSGDLTRFVEFGTQCMRARVRFRSLNPRQQFQANIDQFIWTME